MSKAARTTPVRARRVFPKGKSRSSAFNVKVFLDTAGLGRKVSKFGAKEAIFSQGDTSTTVYYIQEGGIKLTVVNSVGKEAIVAILGPGDFFGEGCLAGESTSIATATANEGTTLLLIEKDEMMRVLHGEHDFSDRFIAHMLSRNVRAQRDLID